MAESRRFPVGKIPLAAAAIILAAAISAGIYVRGGGERNGAAAAACAAAGPAAASLDPAIGGELAAFQVAAKPDPLSELAFTGPGGKPMTLADFRGKVTLVNLWATWCVPCREEMPALDRLQAALGGTDFTVVPVSIDLGDPARPAEFLKTVGAKNLALYTDPSMQIFEALKTRGVAIGLPVTLLLDRNGCRLGHINGPAEWDSEDGKRLIEAALKPRAAPAG